MKTHWGIGVVIGLIFMACGAAPRLSAQEAHPSDLTASDLAEVLSIHWWTVNLPKDLKPGDTVGVEAISSNGKRLAGGGGLSSSVAPLGDTIRIYCWEDKAGNLMNVMLKTAKGDMAITPMTDYFKDAARGGPSNGSVLNVGDILFKFDPSKTPSLSGGNELSDGQVGLRVVVTRK